MAGIENIFLARHASSARNERACGAENIPDCRVPLSETGLAQADAAGHAMSEILRDADLPAHSLRVWCSPYERTRQTRDAMTPRFSEYIMDSREDILLTEWNFGLFDGLTDAERHAKYPAEASHYDDSIAKNGKFYARPMNGESWQDVCVRVRQFFGTIVRDSEKKNPVKNILIISHGLAIRAFVMMWMHHSVEWLDAEPNPNNCAIRRIRRAGMETRDMGYLFSGFGAKTR